MLDPVQWRERGPVCAGVDMPEDFHQGGNFFASKEACETSARFRAALDFHAILDHFVLVEDQSSEALKTRFVCRNDVHFWIEELDLQGKPRYRIVKNFKKEKEQCEAALEDAKKEFRDDFFRRNPGLAKFKNKMERDEIVVGMPESLILLRFGAPYSKEPDKDKKGPVEVWHYNKDGLRVRFIFRDHVLTDYKLSY